MNVLNLTPSKHAASFRDPDGFMFQREGKLYRQINRSYRETYERLRDSGFYQTLIGDGLLIPHIEVPIEPMEKEKAAYVIQPEQVPFISYPYEWSFSQLKDAALLTLALQKLAIEHQASLKDASAYNIQFHRGKPVFIDTLSFEFYDEGTPWVAYRQFCQHFLGPLALMAYTDVELVKLSMVYIDGPPLDLVSRLLPWKSRLSPGLLMHVHLHARSQKQFEGSTKKVRATQRITRQGLLGLIDNLESTVRQLQWHPQGTEWGDYYANTNYSDTGFEHKRQLIQELLAGYKVRSVWDIGANCGEFSRVAAGQGIETIAFDIDPAAVEQNYLQVKKEGEAQLLPLLGNITNPSPSLGWSSTERDSLIDRGPADMIFALAIIHHLAISNNLPLENIAEFFSRLCKHLIIEFVPKGDSQVQRLLATREDIFSAYHRDGFETAFSQFFAIEQIRDINETHRTLYSMTSRKV